MNKINNHSYSTYINTNAVIIAIAIIVAGVSISNVFAAQSNNKDDETGGGPLKESSFYVKTEGPFSTEANKEISITHSCDKGDIAIGGGMYKFENDPIQWKTIKSAPSVSNDTSQWTTSVVFEAMNSSNFWVATKCLDLAPHRK
jgi:hypothetical protein